MNSSSVAISGFELVTGGPGPNHPKIVPSFDQPFTLLAENGWYRLTFFNRLSGQVRVYAKGFSASSPELWWSSLSVENIDPNTARNEFLNFNPQQLNGSNQIWVGCWWDDGSYPGTAPGVACYFADHPEGPGHHTVPILVG